MENDGKEDGKSEKVDNLKLWNAVCETDPAHTKDVNDGRHKFTAINAQSQILRATKEWGPYGGAWKLHEMRLEYGKVPQLVVMHAVFMCPLATFPIMNAIKHTSNKGLVDDDHLKRLETDTITKALSRLGFNADVFLGLWDDNKYVADQQAKHAKEHRPGHAGDDTGKSGQAANVELASNASLQKLHAVGKVGYPNSWDEDRAKLCDWASEGRTKSSAQLTQPEMDKIIDHIESVH